MKSFTTLFFALTFLLFSCSKDKPQKDEFSSDDFPVKVGNWWRYQVYDAFSHVTDTLTLRVVSKTINGNQTKFDCELYKNLQLIDTAYYLISDTKIEYNSKNVDYSYFGNFYLSIPFQKGDIWKGVYYNQDSILASDIIPSMKILNHDYKNVYSLNRNFYALGGYRLNQLLFICQKIGVIYQSFDLQDGGNNQKQTFQLIDYNLE